MAERTLPRGAPVVSALCLKDRAALGDVEGSPIAFRRSDPGLREKYRLLITQRFHGIHGNGAAGGDETSQGRGDEEQERYASQDERVA